jgi:hypothetical protein
LQSRRNLRISVMWWSCSICNLDSLHLLENHGASNLKKNRVHIAKKHLSIDCKWCDALESVLTRRCWGSTTDLWSKDSIYELIWHDGHQFSLQIIVAGSLLS